MGSKLFNILDLIGPTQPKSDSKTIVIIIIALVVVLAVAFIATKCIKKNNTPEEIKKTSKKK